MWLFAKTGFVSIVAHRGNENLLLVRSRFRGDIEALFPDAQVWRTPDADYLYRAEVHRLIASDVIYRHVLNIDYDSFKDSVPEERHPLYMQVWSLLLGAQG